MDVGSRVPTVGALGDAGAVAEKVGMRALKSSSYSPHPNPLPEGEGIIRGYLYLKPIGRGFNCVLAPEGEILFFACPSHVDVVNVENVGAFFHKEKYSKESPRIPLNPAPQSPRFIPQSPLTGLSRRKLRCSARHTEGLS